MQREWNIIKDPAPFRAIDGSYHADMQGVRAANEIFFNKMMVLKRDPNLDLPLTDEQLRRIINLPSYRSLAEVLQDGLNIAQSIEEDKGMRK